jgi:hypothetical protein
MESKPSASVGTVKPLIAGILLIVVAVQYLATGGILFAGAGFVKDTMGGLPGGSFFETLLVICGSIAMILGIIVFVGGISSITRKSLTLSIVGCVFGLFVYWFYYIGTILSIIAIILLLMSKDEF